MQCQSSQKYIRFTKGPLRQDNTTFLTWDKSSNIDLRKPHRPLAHLQPSDRLMRSSTSNWSDWQHLLPSTSFVTWTDLSSQDHWSSPVHILADIGNLCIITATSSEISTQAPESWRLNGFYGNNNLHHCYNTQLNQRAWRTLDSTMIEICYQFS